ncbi:MAG TPA: HAMP domain-containing sensor histidine kinase [Streptosporangiaceae bacterium]|nr:HAMP domain-containing sensor histidine kinase [Streptosporangiaceae bacterium]
MIGTLRFRLALLYAGFFFVCGVVVLVVPVFTINAAVPAERRGAPVAPHADHLGGELVEALVILAALAAVSAAVGWLIAGRFLRPLRVIIATARDISASDLHRRLALAGRDDEFTELGATLDGLFARLEAAFQAQRRFVASASHELRTPLAAERSVLQVALADTGADARTLREACREVINLGAQQERLIDALLTLASSERGVERWEPFDLADVVAKVLVTRRDDAERRAVGVATVLGPAPTTGDLSLAESLVANLADNAIRHNGPGGRVEISTGTAEGRATITVANTGPVIPARELDRLFEPFQRLGTRRIQAADGHGLGLAIVRAIAGAHGATLRASARTDGGLDIAVSFPAARTLSDG